MTALPRSLQLRPAPAREMGATMRAFKFAVAATITIFVAVIQSGAAAKNRSCAVAEKTEANNRLGEIAADKELQKRLIRWHLRFGTPKPTGPTDNERILVQGGYVMDYDGDLRTALWAAYRLTAKDQIEIQAMERGVRRRLCRGARQAHHRHPPARAPACLERGRCRRLGGGANPGTGGRDTALRDQWRARWLHRQAPSRCTIGRMHKVLAEIHSQLSDLEFRAAWLADVLKKQNP